MTTAPDEAVPPGVQPERTALAWHRTALAVAVGALAAGRLLEPLLGPGAWALTVVGVPAAVVVAWAGSRRARAWAAVLDRQGTSSAGPRGPGGALLGAVALGVLVLGAAALVLLLG